MKPKKLRHKLRKQRQHIADLEQRITALEHHLWASGHTPTEMQHELDTEQLWRTAVADWAAGDTWEEDVNEIRGPNGYL